MTDTDEELQELRERTETGTRAKPEMSADQGDELEDAIVALLEDVENGDLSKMLSVRDERLAALVRGLEDTEQLDDVGAALADQLGRDADLEDVDRSEMLRLAIRVGLQEAAPEVLETARAASARHASEQF